MNRLNQGSFCTGAGVTGDVFLSSSQLAEFQACALEPWGSGAPEGGSEYGITQGHSAITNHLPRADLPDRIRPDAQLAIIYMSDERAYELKERCGAGEQSGLAPIDPACLQSVVGPTVDLLLGVSNPEGAGRAYGIVSPPPDGCGGLDQVGQGYLEIAAATGGLIFSICEPDLRPALLAILHHIIGISSPITLPSLPISATLAVALEDRSTTPPTLRPLPRSGIEGFDYLRELNTLVFPAQNLTGPPYEIQIGYQRWRSD